MKEIEASMSGPREHNISENGGGDSCVRPQIASMKALKLPPNNEEIKTIWTHT